MPNASAPGWHPQPSEIDPNIVCRMARKLLMTDLCKKTPNPPFLMNIIHNIIQTADLLPHERFLFEA